MLSVEEGTGNPPMTQMNADGIEDKIENNLCLSVLSVEEGTGNPPMTQMNADGIEDKIENNLCLSVLSVDKWKEQSADWTDGRLRSHGEAKSELDVREIWVGVLASYGEEQQEEA